MTPQDYSRLLRIARSAIAKCYDRTHLQYDSYGGRGTEVWRPWLKDVDRFAKYLRTLPGWDDPELKLALVDKAGHFEPDNVHFVSSFNAKEVPAVNLRRLQTITKQQLIDRLAKLDLKRIRRSRTQADVARMAGTTQSIISKVENKDFYAISQLTLERILHTYSQMENVHGSRAHEGNPTVRYESRLQDEQGPGS